MICLVLLKMFTFSQILKGVPKLSISTVYICNFITLIYYINTKIYKSTTYNTNIPQIYSAEGDIIIIITVDQNNHASYLGPVEVLI